MRKNSEASLEACEQQQNTAEDGYEVSYIRFNSILDVASKLLLVNTYPSIPIQTDYVNVLKGCKQPCMILITNVQVYLCRFYRKE